MHRYHVQQKTFKAAGFFNPSPDPKSIESWLNSMSAQGYELVSMFTKSIGFHHYRTVTAVFRQS